MAQLQKQRNNLLQDSSPILQGSSPNLQGSSPALRSQTVERPVIQPAPAAPAPVVSPAPVQATAAPPQLTPEQETVKAQLEAEAARSGTLTPEKQAQLDAIKATGERQEAERVARLAAGDTTPPPTDRPIITETGEGLADTGFEIPEPRTLEEIRKEQLAQAQSMIDATQGIFQQEIQRLEQQGAERLAQTSSIQVAAGLAGSPFQQTAQEQSAQATNEILAARQAERRSEVARIMAAAQDRSTEIFDREITRFQTERGLQLDEETQKIAQAKARTDAAKESITNIAASGASLDDMDPTDFQNLLADSGLSEFEARSLWALSNPQANAQFSQQGDRFVGGYFDPATGQFKTIISDPIPELSATEDATLDIIDGVPYVISKDENGNLTGSILPGFQAQEEEDEVLSVSEAESLGVPFGTTRSQAAALGITPGEELTEKELEGQREQQEADSANQAILTDKVELIDSILTSEGLKGSVGSFGVGRFTPFKADRGARQEFAASVNQLISKETIDTLVNLKARGGTLGALSDQERVLLQNAATKLGTWMQKDKNGNPTGKFEIGEDAFKRELENIKEITQRAIEKFNEPADDIDDFLDSFNQDLGTSEKGQIISLNVGNRNVKVSSSISNRLKRADDAYFRDTGKHIPISEGFRTGQRQAELFAKSQRGEIGRAAPPGQSFHETGKAIDVGNAWQEVAPYLKAVGFKNNLPDDRGHFSIGEFA